VNARIGRLHLLLIALFALLIGTVTYWQVWAAPGLATRQANPRLVYRELTIDRGSFLTSDGVVLARNRLVRKNGRDLYYRTYPQDGLAAQLVGYSSLQASRAGLEQQLNDYLTGATGDLGTGLTDLLDRAAGRTVKGNDVVLNLSARGQREALAALRESGRRGAVVAVDPRTGALLVMASSPSFDPNAVDKDLSKAFSAPGSPALNRATQGLYPPGSTFKVVTAAVALDAGAVTPTTQFPGPACVDTAGPPLCNFRGERPGPHDFRYGLVHSVNTTFAEVGKRLGKDALLEGMKRFGFGSKIPMDYPSDQVSPSGLYRSNGQGLLPDSAGIDVQRTAIGQERLLATPLQMCLVAAAVANGGRMMEPQPVKEVRSPGGGVVDRPAPRELGAAMTPQTAGILADFMRQVVDDGTGTAATLPGIAVAGKTGTAETGRGTLNDAWFIGFAPANDPQVAIAVVLEDTDATGGTVSAPIAARVLKALL
jgi:peptidoglycan glycosyltransferase